MKRRPPEEILELTKPHADQFPIVDGLMCVEVKLPNDLAYLALLQGFVAQMTNYWSYQGDNPDRKAVARLMQNAYTITDWDNCMNCEELIECLTPLLEAQTQQITNNILNMSQYGTENPGQPMSGEQSGSNLANGTNPTCDLDVLWAQCLAIIQYTNAAIVDVLQKVEAASNVVELAGLIAEIPLLGLLAQQLGSELATETINYYQEAIEEQYNAQYTTEVEIDLACQLFCLARTDCVLSVDLVFGLFAQRLVGIIPTTPSDLISLIEIIAGVSFDTTVVVDVCFYFAWGAAKLGQFLFGEPIATTALQVLVQTAVNDASDDWQTLCDCDDCVDFPFAVAPYDWEIINGSYAVGPFTGEMCYLSEVVGLEVIVTIKYTFTAPTKIARSDVLSTHPDMYVSITTDDGDICVEEYHPAQADEWITHTTPVIAAANWLQIKFRREVPDGELELNTVRLTYNGPAIADGTACP